MAFNLPPPWDPGFALPENVRDEGLERRAFVTKWMPRGTYDDPAVGDGGYAVPGYVLSEGYGQGTHTTKWSPRGTVQMPVPYWLNQRPIAAMGPRRNGARKVQFALSGTDGAKLSGGSLYEDTFPEPYDSYGKRAAAHILAKVSGLPSDKKKIALKKILDTLDPSLWSRTAAITRRLIAKGLSAVAALRAALARALSAGIIAELIRTGQSGQAPAASGQLGLGCYGCVAIPSPLGGIKLAVPGGATPITSAGPVTSSTGAPTGTSDGVCTSDGKLILSGNKWRVRAPDEPCTSKIASEDTNYIIASKQPIYVGPMIFDPKAGPQVYAIERPDQVPKVWLPWIQQVVTASTKACVSGGRCSQCIMAAIDPTLTGPCNQCMDPNRCKEYSGYENLCHDQSEAICTTWQGKPITYEMNRQRSGVPIDPIASQISGNGKTVSSITTGKDAQGNAAHFVQYAGDPNTYAYYTAKDWASSLPLPGWCFGANGLVSGLGINLVNGSLMSVLSGVVSDPHIAAQAAPFAFFYHPVTGDRWGMWLALASSAASGSGGPAGSWNVQADNPNTFRFEIGFAPFNTDPPWWQEMLEFIFYIPALLFDIVDTVVTTVVTGLGDLACGVMGAPGAVQGATAAGGAVGGPAGAAAGGAGAAIVAGVCGGTKPVVAPPQTNWTEYILIGGGALALVLLATRKKKKPITTTGAP
jgi:hypothetical protein